MVRDRGEDAWRERVIVRKRRKLLGVANGMFVAARSSLLDKHKDAEPRATDLWTSAQIPAPQSKSDSGTPRGEILSS